MTKPGVKERVYGAWRVMMGDRWIGHQDDRRREPIPKDLSSQDHEVELDDTREDMMSTARAMVNTFGLLRNIIRKYAIYTIGDCDIVWQTDDPEWNERAREAFRERFRNLDVRGIHSGRQMSRMALMRMLTDGDILARKVRRRIGRRDFPRIEPIEADRVGPEMAGITMREGQVSGVFFNRFGEPTEYEYFDRDRFGSFRNGRRIPANEMLHLYDEERFDAYRGVSHFRFGSLEHSRDLREIIRAEKTGVKNHSKFAALIKNMTGGVEGDDDSINLTESSSETPKAKKEDMPDGIMQRMEPGEDLQLLASNRPTQAWQGFVEMLVNDCAVSMELPVQFVWNLVGLGGPSTRFMLRQAGRVFSSKMDLFEEKWLIPIATWIIAMEIEQGRLDRNPQWMRFEPQRPAMPGIDAGREAKANVDEYTQGFLSGQDVVSQQGRNFREVTRERAREAKDQIDIAEEFDIPLWMLRDKPPGAVSPTEDDTSQNDNARSDRAPAS